MAATGIGYAGLDGAWWLPAVAPFPLPAATAGALPRIGRAPLAPPDARAGPYDRAATPRALLTHRVPPPGNCRGGRAPGARRAPALP